MPSEMKRLARAIASTATIAIPGLLVSSPVLAQGFGFPSFGAPVSDGIPTTASSSFGFNEGWASEGFFRCGDSCVVELDLGFSFASILGPLTDTDANMAALASAASCGPDGLTCIDAYGGAYDKFFLDPLSTGGTAADDVLIRYRTFGPGVADTGSLGIKDALGVLDPTQTDESVSMLVEVTRGELVAAGIDPDDLVTTLIEGDSIGGTGPEEFSPSEISSFTANGEDRDLFEVVLDLSAITLDGLFEHIDPAELGIACDDLPDFGTGATFVDECGAIDGDNALAFTMDDTVITVLARTGSVDYENVEITSVGTVDKLDIVGETVGITVASRTASEPAVQGLMGLGLLGVWAAWRRRRAV